MLNLSAIPAIPARNYTEAERSTIDLVVLHSMETPMRVGIARDIARWAAGPDAAQTSWHYGVDAHEIIRSVRDEDIAWAAPGANRNGLHIEQAGRAAQTREEWLAGDSGRMLELSVELCAALCARWKIPARYVIAPELVRGNARGITLHSEVTKAWPAKGSHTDPGAGFPIGWYIGRVMSAVTDVPKSKE